MKRLPSLILGIGIGVIFGNSAILKDLLGSNLVVVLGLAVFLVGTILIAINKDGLGTR